MAMKVNKEEVAVWIYTDKYKIKGHIHIVENSRISDALAAASKKSQFIPVTDATIYFGNKKKKTAEFIMVQIKAIEIIYQFEEKD